MQLRLPLGKDSNSRSEKEQRLETWPELQPGTCFRTEMELLLYEDSGSHLVLELQYNLSSVRDSKQICLEKSILNN